MVLSCGCENKLEAQFSEDVVDLSLMDEVFRKYKEESGNLISVLQYTQEVYGFLPLDALKLIAEKTGNKKAKIYGIATFYSQFRLTPRGKYMVLQCQGTACHVNGSKLVSDAICEELGIVPGGTSEDGLFTVEDVACLGCCSLAPVIMINGEAYGNLTPESARKIIKEIYKQEKEAAVK
jgi:NADH-quinone oxidoreductase subunit E